MKKVFFLLLVLVPLTILAQPGKLEPSWVSELPVSSSDKYYFRVTYAEGDNYDDAYVKAFARAVYENACKRGIYVDVNVSLESIESDIAKNIQADNRTMNLFINKACEWWIKDSKGKIQIYILWQIGKFGREDPNFDPYVDCYN